MCSSPVQIRLDRPAIPGTKEKPMPQRRPARFWNHLFLGMLVFMVSVAALGTVAGAAEESGSPSSISSGGAP